MANIGDLKVLLSADDKASGQIQKSAGKIKQNVNQMKTSFLVLGGIITATFAASVKDFMETGDELHKMSIRTGIAVDALDRLGYVMNLSGNSLKDVEILVKMLTMKLNDFRDGGLMGAEAIEKLGIEFEELDKLDTEGKLLKIFEVLAEMEDETVQLDAAMATFGNKMGMTVIPVIDAGVLALHDMIEEAKENAKMTQEQADKAAILTDKMFALKERTQAVSIEMAESLTPAMLDMIEGLNDLVTGLNKASEFMNVNMPTAIAALITSISLLRVAVQILAGQVTLATGGLNLVVAGLITFGVWLITTEDKVKKFQTFWKNTWTQVVNTWKTWINNIIEGINSFTDLLGIKAIPLLKYDVPDAVHTLTDSWRVNKNATQEVTDSWKSNTETMTVAQDVALTMSNTLLDQNEVLSANSGWTTTATTVMEDFTHAQGEGTKKTQSQTKAVNNLSNAMKGLRSATGGAGGGLGGGLSGAGGGGGVSIGQMYNDFPSLLGPGAQGAYNAAVAQLLSRRNGGTGVGGAVTGGDISNWRSEHGAFQTGGMIVNTVTSSGVTKLLNDANKRGASVGQAM